MPLKSIANATRALSLLVLSATPICAQSMFEQMPSIPDDNTSTRTANAAPMEAPAPAVPAMTAPATSAVPPAQSLGNQSGGADCGAIQKTLTERKNLVAKANASSQPKAKKMTPQEACALFGQLQSNGNVGIKWITTNKEWCSIPDSFAEGFKADNARVAGIRAKVCSMASQVTKMEQQAREGGGASGGLLGGPGLSGSFRMPQGAL